MILKQSLAKLVLLQLLKKLTKAGAACYTTTNQPRTLALAPDGVSINICPTNIKNCTGGNQFDPTTVTVSWSRCTTNNLASCNSPTSHTATGISGNGNNWSGTNCVVSSPNDAAKPWIRIQYTFPPSTDFQTNEDDFFIELTPLQCSLTVPASGVANWLVLTGQTTGAATDLYLKYDASKTYDIRLAGLATTTPSGSTCATVTIEEIKHVNPQTIAQTVIYTVAGAQAQTMVTISTTADAAILNLVMNPTTCGASCNFDSPSRIYVKFKVAAAAFATDTTAASGTPQFVEKYFEVLKIIADAAAPTSYASVTTQVDMKTHFKSNFDAYTLNANFDALKKSSLTYSYTATKNSVVQAVINQAVNPPAEYDNATYISKTFQVDAAISTQINEISYTRVSGVYTLTFTAAFSPIPGYSVTKNVPFTVQNNCGDGTVTLSTVTPITIPYVNPNFVANLSSQLSQVNCLPMSVNSKLKFNLQSILYGASNTVVVNSSTNNAGYNQVLPAGFNGADFLAYTPAATYDFVSEHKLTYRLDASYDTVDTVLNNWTQTIDKIVNVFKIIPAATETLSFVINATPAAIFTIDLTTKFSTNMDGVASFEAYYKSQLTFSITCTNPSVGSNPTAATTNDCCALLFSLSGSTLTKVDQPKEKYCDGEYALTFTAKNAAFPDYTATYSPTIKVKYDCAFVYDAAPTGNVKKWSDPTNPASETTSSAITFAVTDPPGSEFVVTHNLVSMGFVPMSYSCQVQYEFVCPTAQSNCGSFSTYFASEISHVAMRTTYPDRTQLRVKLLTTPVFTAWNGKKIQTNAYIFSTDVIPNVVYNAESPPANTPQYTGTPGHVHMLSWQNDVTITYSGPMMCNVSNPASANWLTITGANTATSPGDFLLKFDASKSFDIRLADVALSTDSVTCAHVVVEKIYYRDLLFSVNDKTIYDVDNPATGAFADQSVVTITDTANSDIKTLVINPTTCGCSVNNFVNPSQFRVVFKHTGDSHSGAYTVSPAAGVTTTVDFNVLRITTASAETLSVTLHAAPDVPLTIDLTTKYTTNMDENPNTPKFDTAELTYTMACTNPSVGSIPATATTNDCCAQLFSLSGSTMTKANVAAAQMCDGVYALTFSAKNPAFVAYTATFGATINVKYDCLYLKTNNLITAPVSPQLIKWSNVPALTVQNSASLAFTIGDPVIDVTHAVVTNTYTYSCKVQYAFVCPTDTNPAECAHFSTVMTQQTTATPLNAVMADPVTGYPGRTQLQIPATTNHLAMELNGIGLKVKAYVYGNDVIEGYYANALNFVTTIEWTHIISVTKNCVSSIITATQKSSDTYAQASSTLTASAAVGSTSANRIKKINLMDLNNQWDSKYCLGDFTSFVLKSAQLSDTFNTMFTFTSAVPPNHATIQLIAEANTLVNSPTCTLSTQTQINASADPIVYKSKCSFVFEIEAVMGATNFGQYTTFTFDVLNECLSIDSSTPPVWQFSSPILNDPIQPIDLSDATGKGKNVYQILRTNPTTVQWYLPKPLVTLPSSLIGGQSYPTVQQECGVLAYTLATDTSGALSVATSANAGFPVLSVKSSDSTKSGQTDATSYKQVYTIALKAQFTGFNLGGFVYSDTKTLAQLELQFYMQDRCLGMYFGQANVKFNQIDSPGNPQEKTFKLGDAGTKVIYNLKDPKDAFEVERITPFLYSAKSATPEKADGKCGNFQYTPSPVAKTLVTWDKNQINPESASVEPLKFKIFSETATDIGVHKMEIKVVPKDKTLKEVTLALDIEVRKAMICSLKYDKAKPPRTDFKYYQQPVEVKPEDFEDFGSTIVVKIPPAVTDCDLVYHSVDATGENIVSKGCTSLSSDLSSLDINTACLDDAKEGLVTLRVKLSKEKDAAANDIFAAFLTITKAPAPEAGAKNETETASNETDTSNANETAADDNKEVKEKDTYAEGTKTDDPKKNPVASKESVLDMLSRFKVPTKKEEKKKEKNVIKIPLELKIADVSQTGVIELAFNRPVDLNFDYMISKQQDRKLRRQLNQLKGMTKEEQQFIFSVLETSFKIEFKPVNPDAPNKLAKFEIVDFKDDMLIQIKLNFTDPLYVSESAMSSNPKSQDSLVVTLQDPNVFYDPVFEKPPEAQLLNKKTVYVPKQIPAEAQATMDAAVESAKAVVNVAVPGTIAANLLLGISLSKLWKAINVLMFVTHVNAWKLSPPANLEMFFGQAEYFASGDWIPKDKIIKMMKLDFGGDVQTTQMLQEKFFLIIFIVLAVAAILALFALYYFKKTKKFPKAKDLVLYIKQELFWSAIFRSFIQSYDRYSMSLYLLFFVAQQESRSLKKDEILRLIPYCLLIGGLPILFYTLLWRNRNTLDQKETKLLYGTLYSQVNIKKWGAVIYYVMFCVRRILFSAVSVFVGRGWDGGVVLALVYVLHIGQMSYLIVVYPQKTRLNFFLELISEWLVQYCFFGVMFCEREVDPKVRYNIGWFSVGSVAICICMHVVNMSWDGVRDGIKYGKMAKKVLDDYLAKRAAKKARESDDEYEPENRIVQEEEYVIPRFSRQQYYGIRQGNSNSFEKNELQSSERKELCVIVEDVDRENEEEEERKSEESYEEAKQPRGSFSGETGIMNGSASGFAYGMSESQDVKPSRSSVKLALTANSIDRLRDQEDSGMELKIETVNNANRKYSQNSMNLITTSGAPENPELSEYLVQKQKEIARAVVAKLFGDGTADLDQLENYEDEEEVKVTDEEAAYPSASFQAPNQEKAQKNKKHGKKQKKSKSPTKHRTMPLQNLSMALPESPKKPEVEIELEKNKMSNTAEKFTSLKWLVGKNEDPDDPIQLLKNKMQQVRAIRAQPENNPLMSALDKNYKQTKTDKLLNDKLANFMKHKFASNFDKKPAFTEKENEKQTKGISQRYVGDEENPTPRREQQSAKGEGFSEAVGQVQPAFNHALPYMGGLRMKGDTPLQLREARVDLENYSNVAAFMLQKKPTRKEDELHDVSPM